MAAGWYDQWLQHTAGLVNDRCSTTMQVSKRSSYLSRVVDTVTLSRAVLCSRPTVARCLLVVDNSTAATDRASDHT